MQIRKVGKFYHYRFMVRGKVYRGSTELGTRRDAQTAADEIRKQVVMGNLGILERGPAATLAEFLKDSFMPYVEKRHQSKQNTLDYYKYGAGQLSAARIASVRISEITDQDIAGYIQEHQGFTAAGINQGLRTLRRALRIAFEWKIIKIAAHITLCAGETRRTRVLSAEEEEQYLSKCTQPWKTIATICIELGMRPGEIFKLKCEDILWDELVIRITSGKSKAAKRDLPMTDAVYRALKVWTEQVSTHLGGWLFPSPKHPGKHYSQHRAFDWHHAALKASGVADFEPYCLRHTALTRLAEHCKNPFTVAAVAGHSSITMTQRYVHPQKDEIRKAFEEKSGRKIGHAARRDQLKVVGGDDKQDE